MGHLGVVDRGDHVSSEDLGVGYHLCNRVDRPARNASRDDQVNPMVGGVGGKYRAQFADTLGPVVDPVGVGDVTRVIHHAGLSNGATHTLPQTLVGTADDELAVG